MTAPVNISIRPAREFDEEALLRLAQLDSARPPDGDVFVAEVDGELRAAVSVDDDRAIADPFQPTADVVELLRLRAARSRRTVALGSRRGLHLLRAVLR